MLSTLRRFISKLLTVSLIAILLAPSSALAYGSLSINTNLTTGSFTLFDAFGATVGTGSGMSFAANNFDLPAGAYHVVFNAYTDNTTTPPVVYNTPADHWFNLSNNTAEYYTGNYNVNPTLSGYGSIKVTTNLTNGTYQIFDMSTTPYTLVASGSGMNTPEHDLGAGAYQIVFGAVFGYIAPANQIVNLDPGESLTFLGSYSTQTTGTVRIDVVDQNGNAATGSWTLSEGVVSGGNIYTSSTVSSTLLGVPVGSYFLTASIPSGAGYTSFSITSFNPQTVNANATTVYTLTYYTSTPQPDPTVVSKTVSNANPAPGQTINYTVNYGNIGAATSASVTIVDNYDETTLTNIVLSDPVNCTDTGTEIDCTYTNVQANQMGSFSYNATVIATVPFGTVINNSAVITGTNGNSDLTNDAENVSVTVANVTDLSLVKASDFAFAPAGSTITYTLTYGNNGTINATGVSIADDYDETRLSNIVLGDPVNCADSGTQITCTVGTLNAGILNQTFTYTAQINAGTPNGTAIVNTASISSTELDSNATDNTDSVTVTVAGPVDLILNKTANVAVSSIGETITYTLTYSNTGALGSNNATGVTITDDYDQTRLTNIVLADPANCTDDGDIITCIVPGTIIYGSAAAAFTYSADVAAGTLNGSIINNTATISSNETDGALLDNADSVNISVANVDLNFAKTASLLAGPAGTTITYTLTYGNNGAFGSASATGVTIVDDYDETLLTNIVLNDPVNCSDDGDIIVCVRPSVLTYGTLAQTFSYTADVANTAITGQTIVNGANIFATQGDGNSGDNADSVTFTVGNAPDLILNKTANVASINAGGTIAYTLSYSNNGAFSTSSATGVTISDDYDETLLNNIVLDDAVNCSDNGNIITCTIPGTVALGAGFVNLTYTADVIGSAASGSVITNTATISSVEPEANALDNTDTVNVTVGNVDLSIVKTANPTAAPAGTNITYTLTYANAGLSGSADATGVTIVDDYDQANLTNIVLGDAVNCSDNGNVISCVRPGTLTYGTIGQTFTYTADIVGTAANGTAILNTATVSATQTDGNLTDNTDTVTVTVSTDPDLSIVKTVNTATAASGATLTYTLTYGNGSVSNATGVSIADDYDQANLTNIVLADPINCSDNGNIITCNVGALSGGVINQTFTYTAQINAGTPNGTAILNTTTINGNEPDANIADDTGSVTVTVQNVDLTLAKIAVPNAAPAGSTINYTLTYGNDGAGAGQNSTGVSIVDNYDETLLTDIVLGDPVNCADSGTQITCTIGALASGATGLTFTYSADIVNGAVNGTLINNTATISANEADANIADNTATRTVTVANVIADLSVAKTVSTANAPAGSTLTYTLTYGNAGASGFSDATTVTLVDDYDQTNLTNIVLGDAVNCANNGNTITCVRPTTLTYGTVGQTFTYTADIVGTAVNGTIINNTVMASSAEVDGNVLDNTANASVMVANVLTDLTLVKTALPIAAPAGSTITYTLTYGNDGAAGLSNATNVVIVDDYDQTRLTNIVLADPVNCLDNGNTITCNRAALAYGTAGQTFSYSADIIGTVPNGTVINNTATISSAEVDGNAVNNTSNASVTVSSTVIDLGIAKNVSNTTPAAGETVTYTLTYNNNGAFGFSDATTVTLVDDYDQTNLTNIVLADPVNCSDNGNTITCVRPTTLTYGTIAQTFTYTAQVINAAASGTAINNTITISATELDGNPADNTANATATVTAPFALTKTVSSAVVGDNQLVTYTVTLDRNTTVLGTINVNLIDNISTGTNADSDVINGNNGGNMTYLIGSYTCGGVTCVGDLTQAGGVTLAMDNATSFATITYQMRSSNAGVPAGQNTTVSNTVTATYAGQVSPLAVNNAMTVTGPGVVPPGGGTGGGSSGNGGGGGYNTITGDLELDVSKTVSLDNVNFVDASMTSRAIQVPEHQDSVLFYKVTLKNKGGISATNVKLKHTYTANNSGVEFKAIAGVQGASYDAKTKTFKVDKVRANQTYTFTYAVRVNDWNSSPSYAVDSLEITSFGTNLPSVQDGTNKIGIGDMANAYLFAGPILAQPVTPGIPTDANDTVYGPQSMIIAGILKVSINSTTFTPDAGEKLTLTLTLENISEDMDLTGLLANIQLDPKGLMLQGDGAFQRGILRPGEITTFIVDAETFNNLEAGTQLSNFALVMVNEIEDIQPLAFLMQIPLEAMNLIPGRPFELAETGPGSVFQLFMALMLVGMAGYSFYDKRRYTKVRELALRPL